MEAWPTTLPQRPLKDFSASLRAGLNSDQEIINPVRMRTYPERDAEFEMLLTVDQWQALRTFYDDTLNQCAAFTAPWLESMGYGFHFLRFTDSPKAQGLGKFWKVTIPVEIIAGIETDIEGNTAIWIPEE